VEQCRRSKLCLKLSHIDPFEVSMLIADWKLDRSLNQQLSDDETMVRDVSDLDDCYTGDQRRRDVSDDVKDTVRTSRCLDMLRVAE
jgi:hypothetical protein